MTPLSIADLPQNFVISFTNNYVSGLNSQPLRKSEKHEGPLDIMVDLDANNDLGAEDRGARAHGRSGFSLTSQKNISSLSHHICE